MKKIIAWLLALCLLVSMTGCGTQMSAQDLMADIKPQKLKDIEFSDNGIFMTDFAARLLQNTMKEGENTLISPVSAMLALSMTANGAKGETLAQMEAVLGLPAEELNENLRAYMSQLPQGQKYKLSIANSIWFRDDARLSVKPDFLQTNADYYSAAVYKAHFDDGTCKDINNWVKENTAGMIPQIIKQIPEDAVMYLINALAFDAQWQSPYEKTQVQPGRFTLEDGSFELVDLMYSRETRYLEDEHAVGFIKPYAQDRYAFAVLLPREGMPVAEYVSTLTGEKLSAILNGATYAQVDAAMPKFETEFSAELADVLKQMGMTDAFDPDAADLTGLGSSTAGNIHISRVIHKTYICVGEEGTKASAATAIVAADGALLVPEDVKYVHLNRPFVYMIIDCETNTPVFLGTMMDIAG